MLENGNRILRRRCLKERLDISYATMANWQKVGGRWYDPSFPKPVKLGGNSVGYFEDEVDEWLRSRDRAHREGDSNA